MSRPRPGEKIPGAVPLLPPCRRDRARRQFPRRDPVARSEAGHAGLSRRRRKACRRGRPWPARTVFRSPGQYLLFRFPQRRPPPTSILQRGSPATLAFSTVDHWPLNMEAIQKLDEPIDLSCCSAIRVEIWNADKYPGTVTLELYANDKLLGVAPVRSTPDLQRDPMVAVTESLDFPISSGGCARS